MMSRRSRKIFFFSKRILHVAFPCRKTSAENHGSGGFTGCNAAGIYMYYNYHCLLVTGCNAAYTYEITSIIIINVYYDY